MDEGNPTRPPIPAEVKRAVRRRCGFGCIYCGLPFFQYDHIVEYAVVQEHTEDNLTLLCERHHGMKTVGIIDQRDVAEQNAKPINLTRDRTAGYRFDLLARGAVFNVGSNIAEASLPLIQRCGFSGLMLAGVSQIGFQADDEWLMLDLRLTDIWGSVLMEVRAGEMTIKRDVWDFDRIGSTFKIRSGPRKVNVEIDITSRLIHLRRGLFTEGKHRLAVEPDQCILDPDVFMPPMASPIVGEKTRVSECRSIDSNVGFHFRPNSRTSVAL